jgi:hypothetical protein
MRIWLDGVFHQLVTRHGVLSRGARKPRRLGAGIDENVLQQPPLGRRRRVRDLDDSSE